MLATKDAKPMTVDDIFEFLGYTGSIQDREKQFLADAGYPSWEKFLTAKGYTRGDITARQKQWLRDTLLVGSARRNRGYSIVGQEVTLTKVT